MFEIYWIEDGREIAVKVVLPLEKQVQWRVEKLNVVWAGKYHHEYRPTKRVLDLPSAVVNHCVPVNGVHAPFCTGHKSQIG